MMAARRVVTSNSMHEGEGHKKKKTFESPSRVYKRDHINEISPGEGLQAEVVQEDLVQTAQFATEAPEEEVKKCILKE